MEKPKILETTLRDGSYAIDFQFTAKDTALIAAALENAGFDLIEIGHGLGLNASKSGKGVAAATDEEYLQAAASVLRKAKFGMFFIPGIGRKADLDLASEYGMGFVRIGTNATETDQAREFIEYAKHLGLKVSANLMKSYVLSPRELAKRANLLEKWGADIICLVDSAGGMLTNEIREYLFALKEHTNAILGFHGHNNLSLAIANTLEAINCGATIIDSSLQGIGRSEGNAPTEILLVILDKLGYDLGIDIYEVMDIGEDTIMPLMHYKKGVSSIGVTVGYAQFHSSFLKNIYKVAEKCNLDPRELLVRVSQKDKVDAPEELVRAVADEIIDERRRLPSRMKLSTDDVRFDLERKGLEDEDLKGKAEKIATEIRSISRKKGKKGVMSVVSSIKGKTVVYPFVQEDFSFVIGNIEIGKADYAPEIIKAIDGIVDVILVDAEYKIDRHTSLLRPVIEAGKKSAVLSYKDNDVWVQAVEDLIAQLKNNDLAGTNVAIFGLNNLASKLSLKLSERGASVTLCDADEKKLTGIVQALNVIRCEASPFLIEGSMHFLKAVESAHVLVGLTPHSSIINTAMIQRMSSEGIVIDAGVGTISSDAIRLGNDLGIRFFRVDMRPALSGEMSTILSTRDLIDKIMGRKEIAGIPIVAGGVIGNKGDVVVDSISNPSKVVGIADGCGHVIYGAKMYQDKIKKVQQEIINRRLQAYRRD